MKDLELKIPPLLVVVICMLDMLILRWLFPSLSFQLTGWWSLGSFLLGCLIALLGVVEFRRHRTTVHPVQVEKSTAVVRSGIYRVTRNPMYVGMCLWLLAFGFYLENWLSLVMLPVFIAYITQFQIKPEERFLLAKFGAEYQHYMDSVRRWL